MKKLLTLLLAVGFVFGMVSCGGGSSSTEEHEATEEMAAPEEPAVEEAAPAEEAPAEEADSTATAESDSTAM